MTRYQVLECPRCQADVRLYAKSHWARCKYCSHEFDPSDDPEYQHDDD